MVNSNRIYLIIPLIQSIDFSQKLHIGTMIKYTVNPNPGKGIEWIIQHIWGETLVQSFFQIKFSFYLNS